ncbi:beta-ketoacyl synthase N-terminal-like domain-containing protein [Kribbella antibiotica]|uniref:beta-ketoacyl synthase N-terminal-like domain-containing protein n=1 Tax=Kribbella antibiotica TaxID=190195 RepID=UPI001404DB37|nr:beta-ketoacyl synthase N-terminal-like domain-containing protein [Kribbella antibiotica]
MILLGEGQVEQAVPDSARRIPSMYVDPVAWLVLESIEQAISHPLPDDVGVLVISTYATLATMTELSGTAASGRVSPLRFAGASPGGAASLACLVHGFRGPSLLLTSDPARSRPVALTVAQSWLSSGAASCVVLSVHTVDSGHAVHTVVLGADE